jgi:4-amino-4-deoxy-L-arabinose transferase-like glycosyltransferase
VALALGFVLFGWDLGGIGLVDETPPLFASSARLMAESGDWLIPQVNGLPRYDKPPLVYWLMAGFYSLPGSERWDPLGSWSAALPSALASAALMVGLALLMAWWERVVLQRPQGLWLITPLLFGLSPLVVVWSRIGVSDSLLTALTAAALLAAWLRYACRPMPWWPSWLLLALAVLTKGPVALVLFALTWLGFTFSQGEPLALARRLRLGPGLLLTAALALPWYVAAAWREGAPFLASFFGYHNLQRFTEVVNRHQAPWWLYLAMLLLASLPWSGLLLLGMARAWRQSCPEPRQSLACFCAWWITAVLLLFSFSATKLPSYWLPATPAAALLVALTLARPDRTCRGLIRAGALTSLALALLLGLSGHWLHQLSDADLADLQLALAERQLLPLAVALLLGGGLLGFALSLPSGFPPRRAVLPVQLSWLLLMPLVLAPVMRLGDALRSQPIRRLALLARTTPPAGVPVAMLGVIRPSFHFYSRRPVAYEGTSAQALVNLNDRLNQEPRVRLDPAQDRLLVVAPLDLTTRKHWPQLLGALIQRQGRYGMWWLDRRALQQRAAVLQRRQNLKPSWDRPRPERF